VLRIDSPEYEMPMDRASRRRSRTPSRSGKCDGAACIPSVVLAIGLAVSVASTVHAAPSYTATPLGTIGGNGSYAWAINASGEVTGSSYYAIWIPPYPGPNESKWHAFAYSGGVMRDLGSLGGPSSAGTAINDSGQIAGFSSIFVGQQFQNHPVLFANGTITDLGTLGGSQARAAGINASGEIVGNSTLAGDTIQHAFIYSHGVMTDLGTLGGDDLSASAINANGQVTGTAGAPPAPNCGSQNGHAFLYSHGKMQDLGTLDGGCGSSGVAINDAGQIAGESSVDGFQEQHAFLWSNGVMQDLGTLGGYAYVYGMNSKAQVVGDSMASDGQNHAFLYTDGKMYDLNDLVTGLAGTLLSIATGINDSGQIVANGCSMSLVCQAFRLDPVAARSGPPAKVAAIEYHYPAFDHYFMTALPEEIAALDGGVFPGWVRTGEAFNVYSDPSIDSAVMCRFFSTAFGSKSSHFFTADPGECSMVKLSNDWQLEGEVLPIPVPDSAGNCAAGTQPVYRLYNNGQGGAPAHRYTTSFSVRSQMLAQGWISEGYGDTGVIMCAPI